MTYKDANLPMNWESRKRELWAAQARGERLWSLETGTSGDDEVLIGGDREIILRDILHYHGMEELPPGWEIEELPPGWEF